MITKPTEFIRQIFDEVWELEIIKNHILATPQRSPHGFVLGGQPGAGKSNLINMLRERYDDNIITTSFDTTDCLPRTNNISKLHKRIASLRERVDAQTARVQTTNPYNTENNNEETKQSHSTIHTNRRHNREEEK